MWDIKKDIYVRYWDIYMWDIEKDRYVRYWERYICKILRKI